MSEVAARRQAEVAELRAALEKAKLWLYAVSLNPVTPEYSRSEIKAWLAALKREQIS